MVMNKLNFASIALCILSLMCSCQDSNDELISEQPLSKDTKARSFSDATEFDVSLFKIHGKVRATTEKVFTRVPSIYYSDDDKSSQRLKKERFPEFTAGFYITFETNSQTLSIPFTTLMASGRRVGAMDLALESALELYEVIDGEPKFIKYTTPPKGQFSGLLTHTAKDTKDRIYLALFPSYNGITDMKIKTDEGSHLREAEIFEESAKLPILFYGTSITQGACASRPGKSYTATALFELRHEVINLGFDGAGTINDQMVDFLVQIPSSVFVIDAVWNISSLDRNLIEQRLKGLITRYRTNFPHTPILLMSKFNRASYPPGAWEEVLFKKVYLELRDAGMNDLYFQPRGNVSYLQWGGGTHPNDAGMKTMADIINRRIKGILSGEPSRKTNFKEYAGNGFHTTGMDNNLYIDGYSHMDSLDLMNIFPSSFIGDYSAIKTIGQEANQYVAVEQLSDHSHMKVRYADRDYLGYSAVVRITDDKTCEDAEFNIVAKPLILPTVNIAGRDWMIFNNASLSRETAMEDNMKIVELVNNTEDIERVLKGKDVNKYEKLIGHFYNYNKTVPATALGGKPSVSPTGNPCPPGFELPTLNDYRSLIGIPGLNVNKKEAVYLQENSPWSSPDRTTTITLANDGPFVNGTLPKVSTSVKYTKLTKNGVTLYFINNGAFNAPESYLLYEDKCTSLLTKDISGTASIRICLGRYDWPIEANLINNRTSGYTGARCVKKLNYTTEPLK